MAANSSLQIEVVSVGIQETVRRLDSLGNAAGRNEAKVKLLTDSLGKLMIAQTSAVSAAAQHSNLMSAMAQQMGLMAQAASSTATQVTLLNSQLGALNSTSSATTNAFQRKSNAGGILSATLRAMATAAAAYLGLNFAKGIVEAADGWVMMQAKLKLATGSMEEAKKVQGELFDVSQRLRVPLDDIGKLYTRMSIPMQRMGKDAQETANQVEFVALALKLNGATAGEASSVMLQYSQSVNAGRLNGAEFNAVAEGAPGILRAIEEELKATGKWTEYGGKSLKKMGADGEISFELMNAAAQRALPKMRKDFEELPLTVDGAIQRIKNAWFKAMGEMGEETGMGKKLAAAIGQLEKDIPKIRDALAGVFTFLYDNFGRIVAVIEVLVAGKLISWLATTALALPALATGMGTAATAITGATGALALLRAGLTALTGPWGVMLALVGTAAVAAWQYFAKEAPKADAIVTAATKVETVNRIALIQKEIDKINERNGTATKKPAPYELTANDKEQVDIITRMNKLKSVQSAMANEPAKKAVQASLDLLDTELKKIQGQQIVLDSLKKQNLDAMNAGKVGIINTTYNEKYASDVEKAAAAVKKYRDEVIALGGTPDADIMKKIRLDILGKGTTDNVNYFKKLRAEIAATTAELELNIATGEKATSAEKMLAAFDSGKNKDYEKLSPVEKSKVRKDVEGNVLLEQEIQLRDRATKATIDAAAEADKFDKKLKSGVLTLNDDITKTRLKIAALTETKTAVKELAAAEIEAEAQALEKEGHRELERNYNVERYEAYMAQAAGLRELAKLQVELGKGQDEKAALTELDKLLDPKKAMNFGNALKEAFGDVGGAIGEMSKALGIYGSVQDDIDSKRKIFMALGPADKTRVAGLAALDKKEEQSKLRMYGAMASGAKGFFSEHTTAHKLLAGTEKAIRVAEMAGTVANFAMKSGLLTAFTGLFIGAKTTEAAVDSTFQVSMLGVHASAALADIGITASTETAKNGLKVPGVLMSFMSWLGPWGMAAGGVAIAAVLGGAFGGGGGGSTFDLKDRQAKQNTGTVLGDSTAKSESISKSIDALADNSNIGLVVSSDMLSALRGIEASMQGLAAAIFQVSGMTTGKNFGITEGKQLGGIASAFSDIPLIGGLLGNILGGIFGGATTTTLQDTGLALNGTVNQFRAGQGTQQFADVNVQTDGGWFGSDSNETNRQFMSANAEITSTIGRVFTSITSTIYDAAVSLRANGSSIKAAMDAYVINTEVSFKDLKGDELKTALENMFSASADSISRSVFPALEAFQSAGEGYYQTVVRVAAGSEQASNALESFGIGMVDLNSLTNKTGDVASELVRQSIMAREAGTTMSDIMKVMGGSMSDLVDGYKALLNIQDTMRGASLGQQVSRDTIRGAGGITELGSALSDFVDGFFTDTEKQVISFSKLRAEFKRINVAMPATKDGFKDLVKSLMAGDAASQELAGRVMLLSGSFADAFSEAESVRSDNIDKAKSNLSDAYDKESSALDDIIDKMKDFTKSLADFKDSLIMGDMSTKSSFEKYATAKANYDSIATRAAGGDTTAIAGFEKSASEMLKLSREVNASGVAYTADYDRVLLETEALRKYTSTQVDVATASLDLLKEQVKGLLDVNESVLTVAAAIEALHMAMAAVNPLMAIDGSHANGLSNVPFDGYIAELHKGEAVLTASENNEYRANVGSISARPDNSEMVAQIKSLCEELRQLKEEQREQTSHMIAAGYDSNERNAQTVVAGTKGAMEDSAYSERIRTTLV